MIKIDTSTSDFIQNHLNDDAATLALQGAKYKNVDMPMAVQQIKARKKMMHKIPSYCQFKNFLFPPTINTEQSSSEATANYKSNIIDSGKIGIDLTGGFGIDTLALSKKFEEFNYVERNKILCELMQHNSSILERKNIKVHHTEAEEFIKNKLNRADLIYLDPARRDNYGQKVYALHDCSPDITLLQESLLKHTKKILVKASPMLDIILAMGVLQHISEIHIVSVNNECKEVLILIDRESSKQSNQNILPIKTVNITNDLKEQYFEFTKGEELRQSLAYPNKIEGYSYLYEPNTSILKAGGFRVLAKHFNIEKISENSHLYVSHELAENFPGRIFKIISVSGFAKSELSKNLKGIKKANITTRNFPTPVSRLRKKLKLKEGGDTYLFATTPHIGSSILVKCEKIK